MRRILLTGSTGQVGWELHRALPALGEVIALDRHQMDLLKPQSIRDVVRRLKPNVIVNPAAYTAVDLAEKEHDLAFAINAEAPAILAEEARTLGAVLVHYSTDYVFDGSKTDPYGEDDVPNPLSVYGRSKLAGEQAILATGCAHLILRTSWVYASRGTNFLLTMLRLGKERRLLRIVSDQMGAPTWARALAQATARAISQVLDIRRDQSEILGIYHVTCRGRTSWYGFARTIFSYVSDAGVGPVPTLEPIPTEAYPLPARRPINSALSNEKLERVFHLALPRWEESLSLCMQELG